MSQELGKSPLRRVGDILFAMGGVAIVMAATALLAAPRRVLLAVRGAVVVTNDYFLIRRAAPVLGPMYPGTLVEFFDYECPACRGVNPELEQFEDSGGVIHRHHFPLEGHLAARIAALVAICAEEDGRGREVHRILMATNSWRIRPDSAFAVVLGEKRYASCKGSAAANKRLDDDIALGRKLEITGVPTFITRMSMIRGRPDSEWLSKLRSSR